ncbi:MAG: class I SAM-dependent methyltransferase [Oscillospiraceae bacterium]|nr:class I SAM-dependent methyltransferase [Oscillospiraceae bacterium]
MRISNDWLDYELLDASWGERLERWGDVILIRPDPQIIWKSQKNNKYWEDYSARYIRSRSGGGSWEIKKKFKESWVINYKNLKFLIRPTGFKHTGLFPEQAVNWDFIIDEIKKSGREIKLLNLFAYTGGASLAAAEAGASVCHVDSSKGIVSWARENAVLSKLDSRPVRWIVDDCNKFIAREYKRNNRYDAIVLDPPSYGRGPGGEIWKLEENIYDLLSTCVNILSDQPLFFILNSYSTGLSSGVMECLLKTVLINRFGESVKNKIIAISDEIGLNIKNNNLYLPSGNTTIIKFT